MPIVNGCHKGWALRYLREARAELIAAQKTPYMAPRFVLEALRKAQGAIYYSLGEPTFVGAIVQENLHERRISDPILSFLVEIERMVQRIAQSPDSSSEEAMEEAGFVIELASDVVRLFTGESA
ncbi:MAG: hypothetical protein ACE5L6_03825 [Candidatus Bathyarchaeia archaeon]